MGIDIHVFKFLLYAKNKGLFGDTMTIGRQEIHVIEPMIKELVNNSDTYVHSTYCESMLKDYFGASKVQSIDKSAYEDATDLHDMNKPLPSNLVGHFDTIIDVGSLEHIFNIPQALNNCSQLCKEGGQIIHILPANNYCGHGFWQFSPELFFSLYSIDNGYEETEVFLADLSDTRIWYRVHHPVDGKRIDVMSCNSLYVMVRTVLRTSNFKHSNIQQSSYVYEWKSGTKKEISHISGIKRVLKCFPFLYKKLSPIYHSYMQLKKQNKLSEDNPGLTIVEVKRLVDAR